MSLKAAYLFLVGAIFFEIIATTLLKVTDEFTRLIPSIAVVIFYSASFYLMSFSLKIINIGVAYALWSGIGVVAVTLAGWVIYKQVLDIYALAGITLIVAGVIILNLFSSTVIP